MNDLLSEIGPLAFENFLKIFLVIYIQINTFFGLIVFVDFDAFKLAFFKELFDVILLCIFVDLYKSNDNILVLLKHLS